MTVYSLPFPLLTTPKGGEFGSTYNRAHPHRGHDFSELRGAKGNIHPVVAGFVRKNEESSILGWVVVVEDDNHKFWGYCHMKAKSLRKVGERVTIASILGVVGDTGSASQGAHLHLTLGNAVTSVYSGTVQNPITYILIKQKEQTMTNRTVGPINAKRRTTPTVTATNAVADLLVTGSTVVVAGYKTDLDPTKLIGGTNKWFLVDKLYSHASTFTDSSIVGLTNLDPVPVGATAAEVLAIVNHAVRASEDKLLAAIALIPGLVIAEQKKPGN